MEPFRSGGLFEDEAARDRRRRVVRNGRPTGIQQGVDCRDLHPPVQSRRDRTGGSPVSCRVAAHQGR